IPSRLSAAFVGFFVSLSVSFRCETELLLPPLSREWTTSDFFESNYERMRFRTSSTVTGRNVSCWTKKTTCST
ncbi:hypothetical protein, partial [Haladaptatus sp. NG-WS-4]